MHYRCVWFWEQIIYLRILGAEFCLYLIYIFDVVFLYLQVTKYSSNGEDEKSQLNLRLKAIRHRLATSVSTRVLLPAISQAYGQAAEKHKVN